MARWKHALVAITLAAPMLAPATVQAQQQGLAALLLDLRRAIKPSAQ
jgi:hypothetical protein